MQGNTPHYHFDGKVQDLPYKGGKLDFEGTFEADGAGAQLLKTAHAEGRLHGRSVAFAPDAEFRTASACFEMQGGRWKLSSVEVALGAEIYSGTGASQADGKLLLELARGNRQVRGIAGRCLHTRPNETISFGNVGPARDPEKVG